tara:strand:- start:1111 stop:1248 length:138 start_codon:yes stop_codon:yes gene_type:complete
LKGIGMKSKPRKYPKYRHSPVSKIFGGMPNISKVEELIDAGKNNY